VGSGDGAGEVIVCLTLIDKFPGHLDDQSMKLGPFVFDPVLDIRRFGYEKPVEKLAAIELNGFVQAPMGDGRMKLGHVARHDFCVDRYLVGSAPNDHVFAELISQLVKDLPEAVSGLFIRGIGPEEPQEPVAPMELLRNVAGEVCQQRQALRLAK